MFLLRQKEKIFANAIAPGTIDTRMLDKVIKSNPSIVGENFYKTSVRHKKNGGTDINKILRFDRIFIS